MCYALRADEREGASEHRRMPGRPARDRHLCRAPRASGRGIGAEIQSAVPEFMRHDPAATLYYDDSNLDRYCEYGLVAVDPAEPDRPVARAFSVPFAEALKPAAEADCANGRCPLASTEPE